MANAASLCLHISALSIASRIRRGALAHARELAVAGPEEQPKNQRWQQREEPEDRPNNARVMQASHTQ